MKRLALLLVACLLLGGCQAAAGLVIGAVRDIQTGIEWASRLATPLPEAGN